jgi:hypothetical protein
VEFNIWTLENIIGNAAIIVGNAAFGVGSAAIGVGSSAIIFGNAANIIGNAEFAIRGSIFAFGPSGPSEKAIDMKEPNLPYTIPKTLQLCGVLHKLFTERMADFTAFDPAMDGAYAAAWEAEIQSSMQLLTDELARDELSEHTKMVKQRLSEAAGAVAAVRYYAERAFKGHPRLLKSLGFGAVGRYRRQAAFLMVALQAMHERVQARMADLSAVGMGPAQAADLLTAAEALRVAEVAQERFKLERLDLTDHRMTRLTQAWDHARQVASAAEVVYRNDEVSRKLFVLA